MNCPRCGKSLRQARRLPTMILCECGWHNSRLAQAMERRSMDRVCLSLILFAFMASAIGYNLSVEERRGAIVQQLKNQIQNLQASYRHIADRG